MNTIRKFYARYQIKKFEILRTLGDAFIIIKYRMKTGTWPHGDEEYERVINCYRGE